MNIKASGRSALIITAGLCICFAGPMRATESDARATDATAKADSAAGAPIALNKFAKKRKHASAAVRKPSKLAAKASSAKKPADADAAQDDATPSGISPSVANANAQLGTDDTAANNAVKVASVQADRLLKGGSANPQPEGSAANTELVSADQLNEVDRSLSDDKAATPTLAMAAAQTPRSDDSAWNQTSLIGKIFIAFGGLLTFASAARMFMA